jgi:hypothetical protein
MRLFLCECARDNPPHHFLCGHENWILAGLRTPPE